jgi:cobalt-zinc-cadmium resistance protein CzcA
MAFNIAFAMAGSLMLSLTLIPVLASMILKPKEERTPGSWRGSSASIARCWSARWRARAGGGDHRGRRDGREPGAVPVPGQGVHAAAAGRLDHVARHGHPSTSLDESIRTSKTIADAFKKFPEVETTLAMIGRAEKGETADVNYMEIYTALHPEDDWTPGRSIKELEEAMQETLEEVVPNVVPGYTQPIQMRVEELISGVRATLALKLYGEDLVELDRSARRSRRCWRRCRAWPTCRWKPTSASRRSASRSTARSWPATA